jgi:hypothetical protein
MNRRSKVPLFQGVGNSSLLRNLNLAETSGKADDAFAHIRLQFYFVARTILPFLMTKFTFRSDSIS